MSLFCVTFGQKSPFRSGWVEIEADDIETAHEEAEQVFGPYRWANIYPFEEFSLSVYVPIHFPHDKLGHTIRPPEGYRHT